MAPAVAAPCNRASLLSLSRFPSSPDTRPHSSSATPLHSPLPPARLSSDTHLDSSPPIVSFPRGHISSGDGKPQRAVQGRQQQIHVYPGPIPEFAVAETGRFQGEILKRLSKDRSTPMAPTPMRL